MTIASHVFRSSLLAALAISCAGTDEPAPDELGTQVQALVTRGGYWSRPHLDVCFKTNTPGEAAFHATYQATLEAALASYTNLDVQFHGPCGDGPDQYNWIRVAFAVRASPDDPGRSSAKSPDQLDFGGYGANATIYMDDPRGPAVWLHELMHSAGFHHAQDTLGTLCTRQPAQTGFGRSIGPYDPVSLMNYCFEAPKLPGSNVEPAYLSDLDLLGLDLVYGAPGQITFGADGTVFRHRTLPGSSQDLRCTVQNGDQLASFTGLRGAPAGSPDDTYRTGSDRAEAHRSPATFDVGACGYAPGFYDVAGQRYLVVGDTIDVDRATGALAPQPGSVCRIATASQAQLYAADLLTHTVAPTTNLWLGRNANTMASTPTCAWSDGYYRLDGDPTVYRLSGSKPGETPAACRVIDPTQLAALQQVGEPIAPGSTSTFELVAPWVAGPDTHVADLVAGRGVSAGAVPACAWPDGNYVWGGDRYRVTAGAVCRVQDAVQAQVLPAPARVRDVTGDNAFFTASRWDEACAWPAGLYRQGGEVFAIASGVGDPRLPHYDPEAVYHSPIDPIGDICRLADPAQQLVYSQLAATPQFNPALFAGAPIDVSGAVDLTAHRTRPNALHAVPTCPWQNALYRQGARAGVPLYALRKTGVNGIDGSINYDCRVRSDLAPGQPAPSAVTACAGKSIGAACIASDSLGGFAFGYASSCGYADDQATMTCLPYNVPNPVDADLWQCPIDPARQALTATCSQTPCGSSSTITVTFQGMAGVPNGFIALAPAGKGNEWYLGRQELNGQDHGTLSFASPGPGTWTVRALAPQGNGEFTRRAETAAFAVTAPVNGLLRLTCNEPPCSDTSTLTASYTNAPVSGDITNPGYLVSISPPGAPTNQFLSYAYSQPTTASVSLPAGPDPVTGTLRDAAPVVAARLVLRATGQLLSQSAPVTVFANLQVTCSANPCSAGSTLTVSYLHLPSDAWIEVVPAGTAPRPIPTLAFLGLTYATDGSPSGSVTVPVAAGSTGAWIARAYRYTGMVDSVFGLQRGYAQAGVASAPITLAP